MQNDEAYIIMNIFSQTQINSWNKGFKIRMR